MIQRQTILYGGPGGPFEGVAAFDTDWTDLRPGVLILPNVLGEKEQDRVTAERIAALGYVGFVADLYGEGKRTTRESPDPAIYMNALNADRPLLRHRLCASLLALHALPQAVRNQRAQARQKGYASATAAKDDHNRTVSTSGHGPAPQEPARGLRRH